MAVAVRRSQLVFSRPAAGIELMVCNYRLSVGFALLLVLRIFRVTVPKTGARFCKYVAGRSANHAA